jgi:ribose transport system substrate-binding protein
VSRPEVRNLYDGWRDWLSRVALHEVVAKAEVLTDEGPSVYNMRVVEDSTNPKMQPRCENTAPPGAVFSSHLSRDQVLRRVK